MKRRAWYERLISAIGGLLLIYPDIVTDIVGLSLVGVVALLQIVIKNKKALTA